jgi:peptide/nickel transport system permease protein
MSVVDIPVEDAGALEAGRREVRREVYRGLLRSPAFIIGSTVLLIWIICAIFGSSIAPHSPFAQNLEGINKAPSSAHLFGTD